MSLNKFQAKMIAFQQFFFSLAPKSFLSFPVNKGEKNNEHLGRSTFFTLKSKVLLIAYCSK